MDRVCGIEAESGEEAADGDVFEGDGMMGRITRVTEARGLGLGRIRVHPSTALRPCQLMHCIARILEREDGEVSVDEILPSTGERHDKRGDEARDLPGTMSLSCTPPLTGPRGREIRTSPCGEALTASRSAGEEDRLLVDLTGTQRESWIISTE